ncbi:MAG: hypothetical protein ABIV50_10900, partial [Opitutus sp.]
DPNVDEMKQTTRVRAVLPNPHYNVGGEAHRLPHRVLAEGRVHIETPAVLAAPRSAILDTGSGPVAYVASDEHTFQQRKVRLGRRGDASVEVLSGLSSGEQIVTEGNLLIDAQAQLAFEALRPAITAAPAPVAAPPSPAESTVPPAGTDPLLPLANLAVDAADALASDDFNRYQSLFPRLTEISTPLGLPSLQPGDSLKSARSSFEPWSTAVAERLQSHRGHLGLKVYQCPMSPVSQKGRWVQRTSPLKNPFFGSAMPDCGEEIR